MPTPQSRINQRWLLSARPQGSARETDFKWDESPCEHPAEGQILVRTVYLSLDPTNRIWMNEAESYLPSLPIGSVMRGMAIGIVEESRNPRFQPGDLVQGLLGWQRYMVSDGRGVTKLQRLPIPFTAFLGLLGHIGLTSYFGLLEIGKPALGETLLVSAGAGAVGSLVGQIGRIKGCHVVGLAGSEDKCRWMRDELGFDAVINYRIENLPEALRRHCPDGIDIYFDNVGGKILEAALDHLSLRARIVSCGMIAQYNGAEPHPPSNLSRLIMKRARMEGFLCSDYADRALEAFTELTQWYLSGKLHYRVDVVDGLQNAPKALNRLFDGSNTGKLMVQVSEEPSPQSLPGTPETEPYHHKYPLN
jgi:NADPH-dependent curcumin reductase CurA